MICFEAVKVELVLFPLLNKEINSCFKNPLSLNSLKRLVLCFFKLLICFVLFKLSWKFMFLVNELPKSVRLLLQGEGDRR